MHAFVARWFKGAAIRGGTSVVCVMAMVKAWAKLPIGMASGWWGV